MTSFGIVQYKEPIFCNFFETFFDTYVIKEFPPIGNCSSVRAAVSIVWPDGNRESFVMCNYYLFSC